MCNNKLAYRKLLQLREDQKKMLTLLIELGFSPRNIINVLGINHKRVWYLLGKIKSYDFGVTLDLGWIHNKKYANKISADSWRRD